MRKLSAYFKSPAPIDDKPWNIVILSTLIVMAVLAVFATTLFFVLLPRIFKSFLAGNLILSLRAEDVFKQNRQDAWTQLGDVNFIYKSRYDASSVTLSVKYKFGKPVKSYAIKESNKEGLDRIK
ncbi:MAG TPA: hypothetical protein DDZ96_00630 [Porphyromonadaceae bacterium]|jgi:hypothetical protein|uniref:hypothetical protein n=1 Tax=Limibacterium fermenti TaxID=3229863 RepID=UPI000E8E6127|nr:hypothetical protein [Porphyromonadaceae bacterium]HBK33258.1 hypothetical protein [Porphyromonadaceae bacterium]HBL32309.1 hypothetical protein [Porphyromonadaceae bacterium]HBX21026.1 hypothetical protein [Porphyromonadaceae bacterium]HBX44427.1 hypothetical protein [Porphyromonadaceae bacterium]